MARGRPGPGLVFTVGATILSQGRLLLHPTGVRTAWRIYRERHPDAGCDDGHAAITPVVAAVPALSVSPTAHAGGAGIALSLSF
jgi:hypothetical protein